MSACARAAAITRLLVLLACAAMVSTACTSGTPKAGTGSGSGTTSPSVSPTSGATPTPKATAKATATRGSSSTTPGSTPPNIDTPASTAPVVRDGKTPSPAVSAPAAPFVKGTKAAYADGISVQIRQITQGVTTGSGPGVLAGRPKTTFVIVFTNNSRKPVDMNRVVVTVIYGPNHLQAAPVYDDSVNDFSGTVAPGRSTNATYSFTIPAASLNQVVMRVDFDGLHAAATFTGKVQPR